MRYDCKGTSDWVEIVGAADVSIRELNSMWEADQEAARALVASVVADGQFTVKGAQIDMGADDWPMDLTIKQWDWIRQQIPNAAREEDISTGE